jgi:hypothetical protein
MVSPTKLALLTLLTIPLGVVAEDKENSQPAPAGCHWQAIPAVKMQLPVPDGWRFREVSTGPVLSYEVAPAGPGLENSKARYRLEVQRGLKSEDAVAKAREFVESVRSAGTDLQPLEKQTTGVITYFSSFATYTPGTPGAIQLQVIVSSAANSRSGTLYTMKFNIPVDELELVAPLGNKMFQKVRLDDTF